jgi:hypothetical protein
MATFLIGFIFATFCAWQLTLAGMDVEAVALAGFLGIASGDFAAYIRHEEDE